MVKKLTTGFAILALAAAAAATSYNVTLLQPSVVNGTELKAGDYKVEIKDNVAVIKQGKRVTEAPVKVETASEKFQTNTFRYSGSQLQEIRIGGTKTKLVFEKAGAESTN